MTYAEAKEWLKQNGATFRTVGEKVVLNANGRAVEFSLTLPHDEAVVKAVTQLRKY